MLNQAANQNYNTASPRKGENTIPTSFRSHRLFSIGPDWYFSTREGNDQGPFFSKRLAQNAVDRYISDMNSQS